MQLHLMQMQFIRSREDNRRLAACLTVCLSESLKRKEYQGFGRVTDVQLLA